MNILLQYTTGCLLSKCTRFTSRLCAFPPIDRGLWSGQAVDYEILAYAVYIMT